MNAIRLCIGVREDVSFGYTLYGHADKVHGQQVSRTWPETLFCILYLRWPTQRHAIFATVYNAEPKQKWPSVSEQRSQRHDFQMSRFVLTHSDTRHTTATTPRARMSANGGNHD